MLPTCGCNHTQAHCVQHCKGSSKHISADTGNQQSPALPLWLTWKTVHLPILARAGPTSTAPPQTNQAVLQMVAQSSVAILRTTTSASSATAAIPMLSQLCLATGDADPSNSNSHSPCGTVRHVQINQAAGLADTEAIPCILAAGVQPEPPPPSSGFPNTARCSSPTRLQSAARCSSPTHKSAARCINPTTQQEDTSDMLAAAHAAPSPATEKSCDRAFHVSPACLQQQLRHIRKPGCNKTEPECRLHAAATTNNKTPFC